MNCEDFRQLLDEGRLDKLTGTQQDAVEFHLESCSECASVRLADDTFLAARVPPVPAGLVARCRRLATTQTERPTLQRGHRPYVVGGLILIGAAAAALISLNIPENDNPVADATNASVVAPENAGASAETLATADVATVAIDNDTSAGSLPPDASFTIALIHVVSAEESVLSRQYSDWFYAAFVDELRRIPDVNLIEHPAIDLADAPAPDETSPAAPPAFPWPGSGQSGMYPNATVYRSIAASLKPADPENDFYDLSLAIAARIESGQMWQSIAQSGPGGRGYGSSSRVLPPGVAATRTDAAARAADQVMDLRIGDLPPTDELFEEFQAQLLNPALSDWERRRAMSRAGSLARRLQDPDLSTRFTEAALALARETTSPEIREYVFGRLRANGDLRMIQPLSDALLYDPDENVRLAALETLGEFPGNTLARTALIAAEQTDTSPEVRRLARWLVLDDAGRTELASSIIRDESLSDDERLAPLRMNVASVERVSAIRSGFAADAATFNSITELVRRAEDFAVRRDVIASLRLTGSASVAPLLTELLRSDPTATVRAEAAVALRQYVDAPGVRAALETAAVGDSAEVVRDSAARMLEAAGP